MRRYKRKETFRYTFEEPIIAYFRISKINDHTVSSSKGEGKIINISPHGLKLNTHLEIHESIELTISFKLNNKLFNIKGVIIWTKKKVMSIDHGINLIIDYSTKQELIKQLKIHSRKAHHLRD